MWVQRMVAPGRLAAGEVADLDERELAPGAVLLRTEAGGICGSDGPKFRGTKGARLGPDGEFRAGPPGFPLHEVVGEVVASRHPEARPGDRVVGWASESDGLAEFVVTDGDRLWAYDHGLDPCAAVLIQSLACVLYPLERLPVRGVSVTVLGLGPIGLLFAHAVRALGAATVTGVDPVDRSAVAPAFGLDRVLCTTSGNWAATVASRPDVVIEAVGHQVSTLQHAIDGCAPSGIIQYFGIPDDDHYPLDMERLMRKNLTLAGGITRDHRRMLARADEYLRAHPALYGDLVTHVLPVDRCQEAFDLATTPATARRKVLLTMR